MGDRKEVLKYYTKRKEHICIGLHQEAVMNSAEFCGSQQVRGNFVVILFN